MISIYDFLADFFSPILSIKYGDKILHFIGFGLLGLLSLMEPFLGWFPRTSVVNIAMFSTFLGIIWEMWWQLKGKSILDKWDVLADLLGGLFFGLLYYFFVGGILLYVPLGG